MSATCHAFRQHGDHISKFYITTPIYYVNSVPHIGTAYTTIMSDILARWHRIAGDDVFFLTGTDEHGEKVAKAASANGESPKEFTDRISVKFIDVWKKLNISYDRFIRTTEAEHTKTVDRFVQLLSDSGDIYKGEYAGWYCVPDETFLTELQLVNGKCPECGREVKWVKEEAYFFRLSKYKDRLLEYYKSHKDFLSPEFRSKEISNRVEGGLKDLDITRISVDWAIGFQPDPKHYIYVWIDALTNYLTGIDWPDGEKFKEFWPADVHVVGKEINWFHSVIWPAMLMSAKMELPKKVFAHGWLTVAGEKMGKSKGNAIDPVQLADRYSADALRYFCAREIPFGRDGDFSEAKLVERINNELVADLGNFLNRVVTMAEKFGGKIEGEPELEGKLDLDGIRKSMDELDTLSALDVIWKFLGELNKYVNDKAVWKLKDKELSNALYNLLEGARIMSILISPFMPDTAARMAEQIGVKLGTLKDCKFGEFNGKVSKKGFLFKKVDTKA